MSENVPSVREGQDLALFTDQQVALFKQTIAKGATDQELHMFLEVARATDLNPFAKEIYFIKYKMRNGTTSVAMPVGIDGLRRKAAESGDYAGQVGPFFCGEDGVWKDVWFGNEPPAACKVGVLRYGNPEPTWAVVKASEFSKASRTVGGRFWQDMPTHMLAITAERHALRKAAPRLVEKIQAAGAQVIDADYLIAKGEQFERQRALPQQTPPGDLHEELYGQHTEPDEETSTQSEPQGATIWDSLPEPLKTLRASLKDYASQRAQTQAEQRRIGPLCGWIEALFPDADKQIRTAKRYSLLRFFWDTDTSKTLTDGQVSATLAWITEKVAGDFRVRAEAVRQAYAILEWWDKMHGQQELPLLASKELPAQRARWLSSSSWGSEL